MDDASSTRGALYLDDLQVGLRFVSDCFRIDSEQIRGFAAQFDPQPFHLDPDAARDTMFGGLAASGWHTAAITMRLLVLGGLPIAGGIIGAGGELEWPRPTRPDDVLRVESEVQEISPSRSRPDRGIVTVASRTLNQRDEVVQSSRMKLVVPRRKVESNLLQGGDESARGPNPPPTARGQATPSGPAVSPPRADGAHPKGTPWSSGNP